jgi:deoxyribodipyrimidine photo-lyase
MTEPAPIIVWFRQDLRTADNPALAAAAAAGPVLPVYVLDDETPGSWALGGASRWWLHHSLMALAARLDGLGTPLILRRGRAPEILERIAAETGARGIFWNRAYEPFAAAAEHALADRLKRAGREARRFRSALLFEPEDVVTKDGKPYQVFTPFWRACLARPEPLRPTPAPPSLVMPKATVRSDRLDDWALLPKKPDWAGGLRTAWPDDGTGPGEAGAARRLDSFLGEALASYREDRDRPDRDGTSRLSPHLHFGELSPRQLWHAVRATDAVRGHAAAGADAYLRELGWREFSAHLLHHVPTLPEAPLRAAFARFPWRDDAAALDAWQRGRTGYPLVDAGMRQLWATGWMHNRVRMVAASFLIKHLLLPWQAGARWFWDTLVDADLANNSASWQWVAGCGADAAPFFRIFNPTLQGEKFDPDGRYVRAWVPELAPLPDRFIHRPDAAPTEVLKAAGIVLGATYPRPVVEHGAARQRALAAFARVKGTSDHD